MITRLSLSNFRSLGPDVVLDLGRLNFLVGVNGSGKSNVLHALSFVREAVRAGLPRSVTSSGGIVALRRHSAGRPHDIRIELDLALPDGTGSYGFELAGDRIEEYKVKEEWARVDGAQGRVAFRQSRGRWEGPENLRPNLGPQSLAITALGGDPRVRPLWEHLAGMMVYSIYPDMLREPQKFIPEMPMRRR
ncbi:MAG: AAA family ATPase, partial [Lentisphaeria bacterium]|nr:AAA family ATPase [Lentisphaeria bacterium]